MNFLSITSIEDYFIDERNRNLWNKLNTEFIIYVTNSHQIYRLDYVTGSEEVYICTDINHSPDLFTHELLHLNLRSLGLNTFDYFERPSVDIIEKALGTMCNCIEHVLFYNLYIELGFERENFTMDYKTSVIDTSSLDKFIDDVYSLGPEYFEVFYFYIYWIIKAEEYTGHNRFYELNWLKCKDNHRYKKCELMFKDIIELDLEIPDLQIRFNNLMQQYLSQKN